MTLLESDAVVTVRSWDEWWRRPVLRLHEGFDRRPAAGLALGATAVVVVTTG